MILPKFEFSEFTAMEFVHVNRREELHGTEKVVAFDLKFQRTALNELLDMLHPKLRPALYFNEAGDAGQQQADGVKEILPNLIFPQLNGCSFKWGTKEKLQGYRVWIEHGIGEPMFFELCKVVGREFEVIEGGSVTLTFTVQISGEQLGDHERAVLTGPMDGEIKVRLLAPTLEDEQRQKDADERARKKADEKNAGDIFAEQHGKTDAEQDEHRDASA